MPDRTAAAWRKSSYSNGGGACVEVAQLDDTIALRNSNHPDAGTLALPAGEMAALLRSVKTGEFDQHT